MPLITFVSHDGEAKEVHVESGTNLMQAAVDNGVDGILGECGGVCSCATCHCYIDDAWQSKLNPPDEIETDMLDCVLDRKPGSRLSCQIEVSDDLDGLHIALPSAQF